MPAAAVSPRGMWNPNSFCPCVADPSRGLSVTLAHPEHALAVVPEVLPGVPRAFSPLDLDDGAGRRPGEHRQQPEAAAGGQSLPRV